MNRLILCATLLLAGCGGVDSTTCESTDTYASHGAAFLAANCRTCHEHASQFTNQTQVASAAANLRLEISTGRMPEGATLSATEKARVLAWLACGAP